jgi:hypothetical protein
MILAYFLEILVFFGEIFVYLKLKWSSLGSLLGFSFCENLMMLKKKQEWQYQCQCFVPPPLQKMFSLCYVGPLPLRFFPQIPYMPHIMNLKKLRLVHFNKVTQTSRANSSCVYFQCVVHIVMGPCAKGHFIHTGASSGPGVLLLLDANGSQRLLTLLGRV